MIEHVVGGDPGVDAEVLGQIAQGAAQGVGVGQDIDVVEAHMPRGRRLQGGDDAHQRGLARPVRAQQSIHPARDDQVDLVQGAHAVAVDVGQVLDDQHMAVPSAP